MIIDENKFNTIAGKLLDRMFDVIDEQLGDRLVVDMENGMLTIETETGGQYVINKHAPDRQIWMSSPLSGASHYTYDEQKQAWIDSRDGVDLMTRLAGELSRLSGLSFRLADPD